MAESADTENCDFLSCLRAGLFHRAVNRQPRAQQRRGFFKSQIVWTPRDVARFGFDEFGESAVNRATSDLLLRAERFASHQTEFAFAARPMQPRHADAVADVESGNAF